MKINKRKKFDESLKSTDESVDVLWKDSLEDPTKHLTKLSQYAGAYATTTVDKATQVKNLLRQRDYRIQELEHLLDAEKVKTTEQIRMNSEQFLKDIERLKL